LTRSLRKATLEAIGEEIKTTEERSRPKNSEVERLFGSNRKIKDLTGWAPRYDLQSGLAEPIKWFHGPANLSSYKTGIYNT